MYYRLCTEDNLQHFLQMEKNQYQLSEKILNITLEIIYLLTGEDYGPVNKFNENVIPKSNSYVFGGFRSMQSPTKEMPSNPSVQERSREQMILDLTSKITELLTGEVPVRSQDVTVYFSMEEWEYIEGHKDQYKGMMSSPDLVKATYECEELYPHFSPLYLKDEPNLIHHQDNFTRKATSCEAICPRHGICPSTGQVKQDASNKFGRFCNEDNYGRIKSIINYRHIFLDHTYAIPAQKKTKRLLPVPDIPKPTDTDENLSSQFKEEPALYDEGTVTYTSLHTPVDPIQYNTVHIKEESMSQEGNPSVTDIKQEFQWPYIKDEPVSCNISYFTDLNYSASTGQFKIKEEPISHVGDYSQNTAINTPAFHTAHHFQEDPPSEIDIYLPTDTEQTIGSKGARRKHVRQRKNTDKPFLCPDCGKSFISKSGLSTHKKIHMFRKLHTCTECNKTFFSKPYLVRHQMIHCGEKYTGEDSEKGFSKASHLDVDQKVHTGKGPFFCAKCGKRFLNNSNFIRHQKIHGLEKPFACSECDKSFPSKSQLADHHRLHLGGETFACPDCGKTFIKVQNLLKHQKLHTGKNPFSCIECGKIFTSNNYLIRHMNLLHTSKKTSYPCATCGKYFNSSLDLIIHQRIHAGGKPGTSSEWRKCFIRKLGFVIHQRNHVKEKPYSCPECKERFVKKGNLFLHQKVHSGERSLST